MASLSRRARENLRPDPLFDLRLHCFNNQYDAETNPGGIVALAVAENKLMHPEVSEHIKKHFKMTPFMLTYGEGFSGSSKLRKALAKFLNLNFAPLNQVGADAINIVNGAGSAVDAICFCIGEAGEGMLVGRPLYVGFLGDIEMRAKTKLISVKLDAADPTGLEAVAKYETALQEAEAQGIRIRGILLANPHNPLGRPYTAGALIGYLKLCSKYKIHLISDEVYAKATFPSNDLPDPPPFVSVLSINLQLYIDPSLVHVIYGMSKDFCANGVRIGAIISPWNMELLSALRAIGSFLGSSSMAQLAWQNILEDEEFLSKYFVSFAIRMRKAYDYCAALLKAHNIPYEPVSASSFIWIDLSRYLREDSMEGELELGWKMAKNGIWLAMGESFRSEKHGNFRLTFATPEPELKLGMERLVKVLEEAEEDKLLSRISNSYSNL